jgi:alkylation response protein AidB-like acyl-CoA dehydrogenase
VSRTTRDGRLADLQMVQEQIADSWIAVESFRLGLIERYPRAGDRRAHCVRLTARSKPLMARIDAIVAALQRDLLGDLSGEALETCLTILRILNLRLDRDQSRPGELTEDCVQT